MIPQAYDQLLDIAWKLALVSVAPSPPMGDLPVDPAAG